MTSETIAGPLESEPAQSGDLEAAFRRYHEAHPEVYEGIVDLSHEYRRRFGASRPWSIAAAFEVLRWERRIPGLDGERLKLPNNHRAFYAREILRNEPGLRGCCDETDRKHEQIPHEWRAPIFILSTRRSP